MLDRNRRPIRGLTVADFTVLEDGKPRPIVQFSPVDLPEPPVPEGEAPWLRAVAPDVVSNDLPRDGRVVVVRFDQTIGAAQQPAA